MNKKILVLIFLTVLLSGLSVLAQAQGDISILPRDVEGCTLKTSFSLGGIRFQSGDVIPATGPNRYKDWSFICTLDTVYYVVNWFFYIIILAVTVMILYAGFVYITSAGDPQKTSQAGKIITFAVIGLIVALFSRAAPSALLYLTGADETDIVMTGDYFLTIKITGPCEVKASPGGTISGTGEWTLGYDAGQEVALTQEANGCIDFIGGWGGDCPIPGSKTCRLNMVADRVVTANCSVTELNFIVEFEGNGSGTITMNGVSHHSNQGDFTKKIQCGSDVVLSASPDPGSYQAGWGKACGETEATKSCRIENIIQDNMRASFRFEPKIILDLTVNGAQPGDLVEVWSGGHPIDPINYGKGHHEIELIPGKTLELRAKPASGSKFSSWEEDCSGTSETCDPSGWVMDIVVSDKTVIANFESLIDSILSIGSDPQGIWLEANGDLIVTPSNIVKNGEPINAAIEAPASVGTAEFKEWEGCDSVAGRVCTVEVLPVSGENEKTVLVTYNPLPILDTKDAIFTMTHRDSYHDALRYCASLAPVPGEPSGSWTLTSESEYKSLFSDSDYYDKVYCQKDDISCRSWDPNCCQGGHFQGEEIDFDHWYMYDGYQGPYGWRVRAISMRNGVTGNLVVDSPEARNYRCTWVKNK